MRRAQVQDIKYIVQIQEQYHSSEELEDIEFYTRFKIEEWDYMLSENNDVLFIFERCGNFKCQVHTYILSGVNRTQAIHNFCEALKQVRENRNYTCFITFIPENNKAAKVAARYVGFHYLCDLPNAGGENKMESLYVLGGK